MKTVKKFSKAFLGCAIFSGVVIIIGIIGMFVKGINFGIDFKPGLIEEVRIAPAAVEITYNGSASVSIDTSSTGLDVVISGTNVNNETKTFTFGQNATVQAIADALNTVDGVTASVKANGSADSYGIFTNSAVSSRLSSDTPFLLYVADSSTSVTADDVRASLEGQNVQVKEMGDETNRSFQIRAGIDNAEVTSQALQSAITESLQKTFGEDNVAIVKTDFVGSQLSTSLMRKSIILAFATILLIWLYATIRFHWDFALGAIVALVHDFLIMFTFISWGQIEFSTTTLAAVLTIFGYSINATVVILDRVRFNMKSLKTKNFNDILDASLSDTLSRSIITTVTTLFASISLLVFTTGSIRNFAIVLTIGLLSGCYSSMFISSGFISLVRRNWTGGEKVVSKEAAPAVAE